MNADKISFTLAEVLVVLVIIGVVASITIPSLVQNYQKTEFVTGLRKFYAEANQALLLTAIDNCNGSSLVGCFNDPYLFENAVISHFKIIKDCGENNTGKCWVPYNYSYAGTEGNETNFNEMHSFMTADGMAVIINITNEQFDCLGHFNANNSNSPTYNYCGEMYVDVNGPKGPNRRGRDVFAFNVTSNKTPLLYPWGGKDEYDGNGINYYWKGEDNPSCGNGNTDSEGCQARIMEEGWQMNY